MLATLTAACGDTGKIKKSNTTNQKIMKEKLQIRVNKKTLTATLYDSAATRDFIAQLPLSLTLSDYHGIEKVANLPKKLSKSGSASGYDPSIGDITYYAPWGNLAIFYRDFNYADGLILIGKIDKNGIKELAVSGEVKITIDLLK